MNWWMLLLLAFLLPLPTGLAAQKKKKEKEKAEQPKIEMTFQEKIKPFGPPPTRRYPKRHNRPGLLYLWIKSRCLMCKLQSYNLTVLQSYNSYK